MRAYYNENDPHCAAWLAELVANNLIAPGDIDTRDIRDITANDLRGYAQHHFFAGIGGWSLALRRAAWPDHREVWTGSCPCQPFSAAGRRGGFADERHLWPSWHWLIEQCRPATVLGEQVASAAQWLGLVRGDLEALGYAVGAIPVEAASAGADHLRDRYWFVAHRARQRSGAGLCEAGPVQYRNGVAGGCDVVDDPSHRRREGRAEHEVRSGWPAAAQSSGAGNNGFGLGHSSSMRPQVGAGDGCVAPDGAPRGMQGADGQREWLRPDAGPICNTGSHQWVLGADGKARRVEPGVRLLVDGFPSRVGLLRGFGNAIDPRPAAAFIRAVM